MKSKEQIQRWLNGHKVVLVKDMRAINKYLKENYKYAYGNFHFSSYLEPNYDLLELGKIDNFMEFVNSGATSYSGTLTMEICYDTMEINQRLEKLKSDLSEITELILNLKPTLK